MFAGTHTPLPQLDGLPGNSDKALHLAGYAGLAFLLSLRLSALPAFRLHTIRILGIAFALSLFYGAADELLQIPVGRHCDIYDWLADVVGTTIGLACFVAVRRQFDFLWMTDTQPTDV